ncbi:TerD family protein [Actinomadura alba]|uniref:TerD family protein n=1 Tax=Actinomadura alba TaxID=406431 RepID=A0ABR7LLB3_9ACTN|nr:TerD family protein [Actinomadura alba]MBC6465647.1 TerD family protein [Actinomadura alba]
MPDLISGANAPLDAPRVAAAVLCALPADVSALLVGADMRVRSDADLVFYNAPESGGVRWSDGGGGQRIDLDLAAVAADVHAILLVVSLAGAASFGAIPPPRLQLTAEGGRTVAVFTPDGLSSERAIIGLEVYRRGTGWKVRAVGQGYDGGLVDLVTAHGVEVDDPGEQAGSDAAAPPAGMAVGAAVPGAGTPGPDGAPRPNVPYRRDDPARSAASPRPSQQDLPPASPDGEVGYVERAWLVWEDASRSLAAYRSTGEHALTIRNDELTGRVPKGRYQELLDAAAERLNADVGQLRDELVAAEHQASAEIAPFGGVSWLTWQPRADLAEGILLGHLGAPELPGLRVPLILRMPLRRATWISRGVVPGESLVFAWSLVSRLLAAFPPGTVGIDVIDASGLSGAGWLHGFPPATVHHLLGGGVATGPAATERVRRLLDMVDLRMIGGAETETPAAPVSGPPVRLVVVLDAGAALADGDESHQLVRLVEDGPLAGVPVLLVETDTPVPESVRTVRVRQTCHNLPCGEGIVADPWVGGDWTLTPDLLPDAGDGTRAPALFSHLLGEHTRGLVT